MFIQGPHWYCKIILRFLCVSAQFNSATNNVWQNAQVTVDGATPGYVYFEAVRGNGQFGDIAIDDVTMTQGGCGTVRN